MAWGQFHCRRRPPSTEDPPLPLFLVYVSSLAIMYGCCVLFSADLLGFQMGQPFSSILLKAKQLHIFSGGDAQDNAVPFLPTILGDNPFLSPAGWGQNQTPLIQPSSSSSSNVTSWESMVRKSFSTSRMRLRRMYDLSCINYHGPPREMAPASRIALDGLERDNLPLVTTREDLCQRGRQHRSDEVVILPELKLIYVIGKKCGSSTIRRFFKNFFSIDFHVGTGELKCDNPDPSSKRTCPSLAVHNEIVNEYFIFGIVRDPILRFYSALKEANFQAELHGRSLPYQNRDDIRYLLEMQMGKNGTCGYDEHLDSQLTNLFTPFSGRRRQPGDRIDRMLPLDFLGGINGLAEDVMTALLLAGQRAGKPLDEMKAREYLAYLRQHHFRPASKKKAALTSPVDKAQDQELDAIVRRLHGQDLVCLSGT